MPEKFFKYQCFSVQTLANLKNRTLWFSPPSQFNDPFDCSVPVAVKNPSPADLARAVQYVRREHRGGPLLDDTTNEKGEFTAEFHNALHDGGQKAIDHEREAFYGSRGIACLTTKHDDMLMWSHYADGHRGFCLEFDGSKPPFAKAMEVRYADSIPRINIIDVLSDRDAGTMLEAMVLTKASCWRYEHEWRIIHSDGSAAYTYDWKDLRAVHFGVAMPESHVEIIALVLQGSPTGLHRMMKGAGGFAVWSAPITYTPFQY
jgi:hypothetical protein